MKRTLALLSLLLLVAVTLSLAACGGGGETSESVSESVSESKSESVSESESESGSESESESESEEIPPMYVSPSEAVDIYEAFTEESVEYADGTLLYRQFLPEGYSENYDYPVFLFLHGAGERGDDNALQMKNVVQTLFNDVNSPLYGAIVLCPQCPADKRWVETDWAAGNYDTDEVGESSAMQGIWAMLEKVMDTYAVDGSRLYVMGLSMGGIGTWDLIMRNPGFFAAAAPICGAADPSCAADLVDMPIYTVHGDADGSVPTAGTREMVAAIRDAGGEMIHYEELPGYGHNVWDYAASEAEVEGMGLIEWLFSHSLEG